MNLRVEVVQRQETSSMKDEGLHHAHQLDPAGGAEGHNRCRREGGIQ